MFKTTHSFKGFFKLPVTVCLSLALLTPATHAAQPLTDFQAQFEVQALGLNLGKAKHSMRCENQHCTLRSDAKPSGFAAMFFKDTSIETIKLQQQGSELSWLSYHKLGIYVKDGETIEKTTNIKLVENENKVICPEKNREWSIKPKMFDVMSIAYAIQHAKNNELPLTDFVLQDTNFQDELTLKSTDNNDFIELDFADDQVDAVKYHFTSQHAEIELWLLPTYNHFPGKIRIVNKEEKTITLSLVEPPKAL